MQYVKWLETVQKRWLFYSSEKCKTEFLNKQGHLPLSVNGKSNHVLERSQREEVLKWKAIFLDIEVRIGIIVIYSMSFQLDINIYKLENPDYPHYCSVLSENIFQNVQMACVISTGALKSTHNDL